MAKPLKPKRLYGRKSGRTLNKQRQEILDKLLPALSIDEAVVTEDGSLDPSSLFDTSFDKTILEIGFGNGERLAEMMRRTPDNAHIGCEPFINGMSAFLTDIHAQRTDNIRVFMDDAILVVDSLMDGCIDTIYVLNPDPWPKKRHHKRRIISQENLDRFSRILKPGGQLIMATDVDDLAEWMVTQASMHPAFEWTAGKAADWQIAPEGWIHTRYEQKGEKAGRKQSYLLFKKKA